MIFAGTFLVLKRKKRVKYYITAFESIFAPNENEKILSRLKCSVSVSKGK